MGIRSRLKNRVRTLLGRSESGAAQPQQRPSPTPAPKPAAPAATPAAAPPVAPTPATPTATPTATPPAEPQTAPATTQTPPAAAAAATDSSDAEAKAARHFERTRRAVLRFIDEQGGVAGLADMHDYSERKYFIGHRRFSDLMETLLEDALIDYDHGSGEARITDKGRELGNTKMPPRKRTKG